MESSSAKKMEYPSFVTGGVVAEVRSTVILVDTERGRLLARRAVSCLVAPEAGDRVLVGTSGGDLFVLAILEREREGACLEISGELEVRADAFSVTSREDVRIASGKRIALLSTAFDLTAAEGNVVFDALSFIANRVGVDVSKLKTVAASVESIADRFVATVKRSIRRVGVDHVRAEQIDYAAEKTMSLHSKNTLMTAETLVKMDAEQIHVG